MNETTWTGCANCRMELEEGMDVLELSEGIMGLRGFIPLNKTSLFCSIDCLKEYVASPRERYRLKRRIP